MTDETKAPELIYVDYNNGLYPDVFLEPEEGGKQSEYALLSAVRANPAEFGVEAKVKPLEWGGPQSTDYGWRWEAKTPFGVYAVTHETGGCYFWFQGEKTDGWNDMWERNEAKAAAQSHCEARVKECLA